jgi:hypothetical protein
LPEEEGKLQSFEGILDKVFYRIKLGPMGNPPGRPIHCVTLTTAPRASYDKPLGQVPNWMDAVKL